MSLPRDIARCLGWRTAEDAPMAECCVSCERRIAGIQDYLAGAREIVWMAPTMQQPCQEQLLAKGAKS